jgi:hypothetical protein
MVYRFVASSGFVNLTFDSLHLSLFVSFRCLFFSNDSLRCFELAKKATRKMAYSLKQDTFIAICYYKIEYSTMTMSVLLCAVVFFVTFK